MPFFVVAFSVLLLLLMGWGSLSFFRYYNKRAAESLARCYEGFKVRELPQEGDVHLIYHTYHGFLVFVSQLEHNVYLPPANAESLLGALLRFNLLWGWTCPFVLPLAVMNYYAQRRGLRRQTG